jgi:uncharacterized protein (UPF0332 family)
MVATSDQFLERAKSTVRAAHQRLAAGRKDNAILEGVVADAARSMYQAINAFFPAVTGDSEGSKIEVRFEKEVVQQGLISRDVFRLFVDGQDSRARIAYRFDLTFTEHSAQEALSRAEAFLKAVEKAIVEHGTVTEVKKTEGVCGFLSGRLCNFRNLDAVRRSCCRISRCSQRPILRRPPRITKPTPMKSTR